MSTILFVGFLGAMRPRLCATTPEVRGILLRPGPLSLAYEGLWGSHDTCLRTNRVVGAKVLENPYGSGASLRGPLPPEEFSAVLPVASRNGM